MKLFQIVCAITIIALATCDIQFSKRPLVYPGWPPKNAKQTGIGRSPAGKRTLVVQIRSDKHVPIVLKRPQNQQALMQRPNIGRPQKILFKNNHLHSAKLIGRKPTSVLKIKLPIVKPGYFEKPYHYEQPYQLVPEIQKLPLEGNTHFISDHFAPIHTIPAPNLGIQDNHIFQPEQYLPPEPKPQPYHSNQYQVNEDQTNDQTIIDPFSGKQKLFAPDPDPSLPTAKIRPAIEPFNTPSNGKPLPADIQSNYLPASQALTQVISPSQQQQQIPELYGIQYVSQPVQLAPLAVQNPTYLVAQSNQLFQQHQQELFRPNDNFIASSYADADLTQEVASNGQILQAGKDYPEFTAADVAISAAPQFAALIAAPPASSSHAIQVEQRAPFQLANVATPQHNGFIASSYFGNAQADSQLLQAFAEEEAHREQVENQQEAEHRAQQQAQLDYQHQLQLEQQEQQLLLQQQRNHQLELQQQQQQYELQQQQQLQHQQQQHQQHQQQQQQQLQHQQQQQQILAAQAAQHQAPVDPAQAAFEEHQRLVQQQLGPQSLRIFVPDDEAAVQHQKFKKRSDKGIKESVTSKDGTISVSSSVEVSSANRKH